MFKKTQYYPATKEGDMFEPKVAFEIEGKKVVIHQTICQNIRYHAVNINVIVDNNVIKEIAGSKAGKTKSCLT